MAVKPKIICPEYREFCEIAGQCRVIFFYAGYFSQNIISAMADAVKMGVEHVGAESATRRRLFSSFIEMAQNIVHYSADALTSTTQNVNEMRQGSVCICKRNEKYSLICVNPVQVGVAAELEKRLTELRAMTMDEIKKAYRKMLQSDAPENSKGAGLGFLTVARDASEPLEFEFVPSSDADIVTFYLKATI